MKLDVDKETRDMVCTCVSSVCIATVLLYALHKGIDGVLLATGIGVLGTQLGYKLKSTKSK